MALTIPSGETGILSLAEYADYCDAHPGLTNPDEAIASAGRLKALCNNRGFLAQWLNDELKDVFSFQERNDFKPPTFVLHRGRHYTIRAVVWLPLNDALLNPEMFSYFEPHDHNFDFLTCGYSGPGYRTVIFEYDHDRVVGFPGEPVHLEQTEDTMLPEGKLMYYFSSRDVHIQYPPEALSISMNLILPRTVPKRQYEFDAASGTVHAQMNELPMRRAVFAAARLAGDGESRELLEAIARRHGDVRTRALAWEALIRAEGGPGERYVALAGQDANEYVRTLARRAYARYGTAERQEAAVPA